MTSQQQRYALVDDGEVFVHLDYNDMRGTWETGRVTAIFGTREVPMETRTGPASNQWFACEGDTAPDAVRVDFPERKRTIAYRLADERLADVPAELTPDEYLKMVDEDSTSYDPLASRIYEAVTEPFTPEPNIITDFLRLDGQPRPKTDLIWEAHLPYALRYQTQYLHLFPGHIEEEFWKTLEAILEKRADVPYCFAHTGTFEVHVKVGQTMRKLYPAPPRRVEGLSLRDALRRRKKEIDRVVGEVDAMAQNVCPHCGGSGTSVPAPPQPKRRRRR
jgi:hypothetical protein